MNSYTSVSTRPQIDLSEEEQLTFDINDKDQVAAFIQEAIEKIQPNSRDVDKTKAIVDGMLEEDFGPNLRNIPYREFVMEHVLKNLNRATKTYNKIAEGVKKLDQR